MAEFAHFGVSMDTGFADHRHIMIQARRQLAGAVQINRHIAQVAVVNPDHFSLQRNGALQLLFVADFSQHAHVQAMGHGGQLTVAIVIQHRQHQQAGVGLVVARQVDLVRIDGEVLAQNRLRRDGADDRQKVEAALEIFLVAQDRDGRGIIFIDAGDGRRVKILANQSFRRRRFFAFQNKRGARTGERIVKLR